MSESKNKILETDYSRAWNKYKLSNEFDNATCVLANNGIFLPYSENILRGAFDAGYNSPLKPKR